jgi:hypothetical protein
MLTKFQDVSTAKLVADIKNLLADCREQFDRDYPVKQYEHKCWECGRVYFSKWEGEYEADCTDCIDESE